MMDQTQSIAKRFCACRLALAVGITWGLGCFILGVITVFTRQYGHVVVELIGNIYWGFHAGSFGRAFLGLLWGFLDGFIGTLVIIGIYMLLCGRGACCCAGHKGCGHGSAQEPAKQE